jgi:2-dehydro-3-deoxyphosphogluconate aldolase / (4S)-4-hydroxy-2-oxoglutarate aldolase
MTSNELYAQLGRHRLVPVIILESASDADPLAAALVEGGLPLAEITLRTDAAVESIRIMAGRGDLLVGAGTVLSVEQADQAIDAGAQFLVAPGLNPDVVRHAQSRGIPICPGACTPTEIEQAMSLGLDVVKFFPAEQFGGVETLKAISGPYGQMRFMPTGGITPDNVTKYLAFNRVIACGGTWMVKPELFASGNYKPVVEAVRKSVELVRAI